MIICAGIFAGITLLTGTGSGGNVFAQRVDENEATASGEAGQDDSIQNDRVPDDSARNENVLGDGDQAEKSQEEQGEIFVKDVHRAVRYVGCTVLFTSHYQSGIDGSEDQRTEL